MTGANGEVLTDEDGQPITDPDKVPPDVTRAAAPAAAGERPDTGAWVSDDFVPGDMRLFYDDYMKMYFDDHRVANAPNAVFPRTDTLYFTVSSASDENPIMIGPMRIAAGGLDLSDRLERDGRVATHGILFATDSDAIRPESTPTLTEIGGMLERDPTCGSRSKGTPTARGTTPTTWICRMAGHRP